MSMIHGLVAAAIVCAGAQAASALPRTAPLAGGGEVALRRDGEYLRLSVTGPRAGLASLCVGDETRVRILHASAAVSEAVYERDGERWKLKSGFDWKLRDSAAGGPTEAQKLEFLESVGWVANADRTGKGTREFRIRLSDGIKFIGVTFLSTTEPMALSRWPADMNDDCAAVKIAQGNLPETAQFRPEQWQSVK